MYIKGGFDVKQQLSPAVVVVVLVIVIVILAAAWWFTYGKPKPSASQAQDQYKGMSVPPEIGGAAPPAPVAPGTPPAAPAGP